RLGARRPRVERHPRRWPSDRRTCAGVGRRGDRLRDARRRRSGAADPRRLHRAVAASKRQGRKGMQTASKLALAALMLDGGVCARAQHVDPPELDLAYGAAETKTLTVLDARIRYLEKGDGQPVLFYHPGVDERYWQWAVEAVAARHRAIALSFDFEGSAEAEGAAAPPTDLSDLLAAIFEELGVVPVHLVA